MVLLAENLPKRGEPLLLLVHIKKGDALKGFSAGAGAAAGGSEGGWPAGSGLTLRRVPCVPVYL